MLRQHGWSQNNGYVETDTGKLCVDGACMAASADYGYLQDDTGDFGLLQRGSQSQGLTKAIEALDNAVELRTGNILHSSIAFNDNAKKRGDVLDLIDDAIDLLKQQERS